MFSEVSHMQGSQLVAAWQPDCKKRRENGERMRKWRENEEVEKYSLSTFLHFLFISSLSIHFLYQSQMSQKT